MSARAFNNKEPKTMSNISPIGARRTPDDYRMRCAEAAVARPKRISLGDLKAAAQARREAVQ
jgi:hypothetical protein